MTNLEKWLYYTDNLFSPESYRKLGWLYVVSSALQRRVWFGDLREWPMFPNLFIIFVGPPAVGKGLVLTACDKILRHHKRAVGIDSDVRADLLFPSGPNDITIESLTEEMANCTRKVVYNENNKDRIYTHASMAFVLQEFKSLFKRGDQNNRIPTFFLQAYDCADYEYSTKHSGKDVIRRPCMSLLAACTPDFIPEAAQYRIFNDGFVSRSIFVFEQRPLKNTFFLKQPSPEQAKVRDELLPHILNLSRVFGKLTFSQECEDYLENWFQTVHVRDEELASPRMQTYYGRKRAHLMKLAAAFHFSESLTPVIELADFKSAIDLLHPIELNMKVGFSAGQNPELLRMRKEITNYIRRFPGTTFASMFIEFVSEFRDIKELEELLTTLTLCGQIEKRGEGYFKR